MATIASAAPRKTGISQRTLLIAIAAVSFSSLLLELALTRLFSVVLFYHFAFLAISIALLGLGAGGVFAYIRREWLARWGLRELGFALSLANAITILAVLEIVLHSPISLELTRWNFLKLTGVYLASGVPFFFTGLLFSVLFAREHERISSMYGADLLGGALACMAVVPLLNVIGGPNAIVFASLTMAISAGLWADAKQQRNVAMAVAVAFAILIAANYRGKLIDIVYAKGVRRDQPWMLWAKWNAISRVEVDQAGLAKYIVIDADASTAIMNVDPEHWDTGAAPDNVNLIPHPADQHGNTGYNWKTDLMRAAPSIANVLRPTGKFAIIGPGGGVDVLRAVANGSKDVTGIEINPLIANDIMRGAYADYSYHLYERPEVRLHVQDGRSFIRNSTEKYDVIQMTLVDTWASTAAGAFALSENNLYTVEAFQEYFDHLKPDGMIAITRWEFAKPREALRVVSEAIEALHRIGVADPRKHFIVISDGPLNVDGRPVLVLAKKSEFTQEEAQAAAAHVSQNPNLHILYAPPPQVASIPKSGTMLMSVPEPSAQSFPWFIDHSAVISPATLSAIYPYEISPVTDDAPFFFFTIKTRDVLKGILGGTGRGMDWRINLGVVVLFLVLLMSILAVGVFLMLPLLLHAETRFLISQHGASRLLYFIAVGLGYILIEIALIQRFVLFLGHPTYALTVVIFLMLLSSGAGSLTARRWMANTQHIWRVLAVIVAAAAIYVWVLPRVVHSFVGLPFAAKLVISALLIVPPGFCMGMPFPTGLRALSELGDRRIEWAWAMNAAASVLGSVAAMVIAIHFGLNVTIACGAVAYLLAMAFMPRASRAAAA
jgi:spermidine synthase